MKKFTAMLLAIAMLMAVLPAMSLAATDYLTDGLVLHYSFDSDEAKPDAITDDSGNGYTGQVLNSVSQQGGGPGRPGGGQQSREITIEGGVAHFPGGYGSGSWWYNPGAAIKVPQNVKEKLTGSFTVTMWVKADTSYMYHDGLQRLFDFGVGARDSIFLRYQGGDEAELRFQDRGIASGADDESSFVAGKTAAAEGKWAMISAVYDSDTNYISIYVNDEKALAQKVVQNFRSIGDLSDLTGQDYGFFIGRTQWYYNNDERGNNPDFGGWIDDLRIYNRAVPMEELGIFYSQTYHAPDMKIVTGGTNVNLMAKQGGELQLPSSLNLTFDDGSTGVGSVVWNDAPEGAMDKVGTFTIRGSVNVDGVDYGKIASANITVTSADSELSEGLEAYYSFENDGAQPDEISDDSGNGNNGQVLNNNDRWDRRQITVEAVSAGKAAKFPGGTWRGDGAAIKLPETARANIDGDYTVSMWVKADSGYNFSGNLQRFFDFGISTGNSIFVRYTVDSGDLRFQDRGIGDSKDDQKSYISTNSDSFRDRWGLLTVTYTADDDTAKVYVNGEEVMSDSKFTRSLGDIPELTDSKYGMFLGRTQWQDGENPDYCGMMDEFRLYSRALDAAEVEELFLLTCPEPMVDVTVSFVLEDGTEIQAPVTVAVPEGSTYTYDAPNTIDHNDLTLWLLRDKSTLTIDGVSAANNTLKAVYGNREATGCEPVTAEAYINTKPELPQTVILIYNTGEYEEHGVTWTDVPESGWAEGGIHKVKGTADGFEVEAEVTVYSITATDVPETVYTDLGARPILPETAELTTSHGNTVSSQIVWDNMPEDKIQLGEDFEVSGYILNYNVTVKTKVKFILRAIASTVAIADTYVVGDDSNLNHGEEEEIMVSSREGSGGAAHTRYALLRFKNPKLSNPIGAKLKLFMLEINNGSYTTFSLNAIEDDFDWEENKVTMNNMDQYVGSYSLVAQASYQPSSYEETVNDWLEFDITDYIAANPDEEYYNFLITASTCATYFSSREGTNPPVLEIENEGKELIVRYESETGTELKTVKVAVPAGGQFSYAPEAAIIKDGRLYASGGDVMIEDTAKVDSITVKMSKKEFKVEDITVSTYYEEVPSMPANVKVTWDGGEMELPVTFDVQALGDYGTYTVKGDAQGLSVSATVNAYGKYYSDSGALLGYASRVTVKYSDTDAGYSADDVEMIVRTGTVPDEAAILDYYPQFSNTQITSGGGQVTEPEHTVTVTGQLYKGVSADFTAKLIGDDPSSYTVAITGNAANTGSENGGVSIIVARYDASGKLVNVSIKKAPLKPEMNGRTEFDVNVEGYNRTANEDMKVFVWEQGATRPLGSAIAVSELPDPPKYSDEILALIPDFENVKENVLRANNYRQKTWNYDTWVNGIDIAFWDTAAYHTGNMETYFTFGDENYLDYSFNWANAANWKGNNSTSDPDRWTWGYDQNQGSNAVLFGDWQICFQSYLDMYMLDPDRAHIDRTKEVMGYQVTKDNDDFWWWADALYMVVPVMTKMYLTTGNEIYLDKLYEYYQFSAELMYDGECGIPNEGEEYTTSAENKKNSGSYFSDPDDYANLFYRDASYVYPLNENPGHKGEKNFWARGNGWVFAGLAKILTDLPESHESYSYFTNLYTEMAAAIIACQMQDDQGRGFWTQSMLQDYPRGQNDNSWGYETSGTAFFTYGLFWGLNSGLLDEATYLEPALRGWKYLSEIALQDSGKVGYVQAIGSNATQATAQYSDQPFGYGAFLLAGCEASRWVGGVEEGNAPYLKRRLWNSLAATDGKMYMDGKVVETGSYTENGTLYLPVQEVGEYFGFDLSTGEGSYTLTDRINGGSKTLTGVVTKDSVIYAPADALASAMNRYATVWDGVTVISHKRAVFYDSEENTISYLKSLLIG